jgi:hypothetical protein
MLDPAFWPTVATVLPVLALAIVVEARGAISRWTNDYPARWVRTMQGILWAIPIALFVYLEPISFQGLEGSKPSHFAVSLVVPTVSFSLGVLVVNPGTELLIRANARVVVRLSLFIVAMPVRRKARKNVVLARKNIRRMKESQQRDLISSVKLYAVESKVNAWDDVGRKRETLAEIAEIRQEIVARRKSIKELAQEMNDTLREAVEIREKTKSIGTPEEMAQLEDAITRMDFRVKNAEKSVQEETALDGLEI